MFLYLYISILKCVVVFGSLGSLTPKWEDVGSGRGDADKEMAQVTFCCLLCLWLLCIFLIIGFCLYGLSVSLFMFQIAL